MACPWVKTTRVRKTPKLTSPEACRERDAVTPPQQRVVLLLLYIRHLPFIVDRVLMWIDNHPRPPTHPPLALLGHFYAVVTECLVFQHRGIVYHWRHDSFVLRHTFPRLYTHHKTTHPCLLSSVFASCVILGASSLFFLCNPDSFFVSVHNFPSLCTQHHNGILCCFYPMFTELL